MSQDVGRPAESVDRRSVLQSIGAAGVLGVSAGSVGGERLWTAASTAQDGDQPPAVRGSVEQVIVTDAVPEATLTLYDPAGEEVAQAQADARGSFVFEEVNPAEGYQVSQTVEEGESPRSQSVRVLSPEYTPPQEFYDSQELTEGFGYLEVRDGTTLAHQVILPESHDPPYPTLILHSGYEPSVSVQGGDAVIQLAVEGMGYALVGVNMRGSACSGGRFDFGERLQRLDGYDMVETIAAQEWSEKVGLFGVSFPGFTQLYVAAAQPPSLEAIAPGAPIGDFYRDTSYPGGIENTRFAREWAQDRDEAFEAGGESGNVDQRVANGDETCEANQQLRLQNRKIVEQMENNPFYEGLFRERAPLQLVDQIDVPTMLIVSWQDEQTGPRAARLFEFLPDDSPTRFVGTNGSHTATFTPEIIDDLLRFYEYYLNEEVPSGDEGPYEEALAAYESDPITVYWERSASASRLARTARFATTHSEWPPADVETWDLYCQPDGSLDTSPPGAVDQETTSYEYAPLSPDDQQLSRDDDGLLQEWEQRPDEASVSFVSEELSEDRVCLGSGLVELYLAATAEDTDVQVTLSEVRPDGQEMFVQMGVLRASRRAENPDRVKSRRPWHTHRREDAQPLGEEFAQMRVELFPFGHVFREGSRVKIAIEVPGGNRDRWAFDLLETTSTNQVAHTAEMPTKVSLPLVSEIGIEDWEAVTDVGGEEDISERPACGEVRHQPCRPAGIDFDDGGTGDDDDETDEGETGEDDEMDDGETGEDDGSQMDDGDGGNDGTDGDESDTGDESGAGEDGADGNESAEGSADDGGPGFTVGGALASLGGAGYLLKRRLGGETTEESD